MYTQNAVQLNSPLFVQINNILILSPNLEVIVNNSASPKEEFPKGGNSNAILN